jgi:hypothetical protein
MSPAKPSPAGAAPVGTAQLAPDGSFVFRDVPPGRYLIRARGETEREGPPLFATFAVAVAQQDIAGIEMMLSPGALLEGRVRFEGQQGRARPAGPLRVRAPLADGSDFGDTMTGVVAADGSFRLAGVMAGTHVLVVEGLSFPWRIAAATHKGRDLADSTFDVDRDERLRAVDVVVSDTAAAIQGRVTAPSGVSPSDALAIAFPLNEQRRKVPLRYVRIARPDSRGAYRLIDLAPGEYLVVAATRVSGADAVKEDVLGRLAPLAARVTLAAGDRATVPLEAVRAPAGSLP